MSPDDQALWARQTAIYSQVSAANRKVEDANRILRRARRTDGVDLAPLEAEAKAAEAALQELKADPEFGNSIQRPVSPKAAHPAGITYDHSFELTGASSAEVGLFLASLKAWSITPRIGGGETAGYGFLALDYAIELLTGEGPLHTQTWSPAGRVEISRSATRMDLTDPVLQECTNAWAALATDLTKNTAIFAA